MMKKLLEVDPVTLNRAGLTHIEVRNECDPEDLYRLIQPTIASGGAHSWRNLKIKSPEESLKTLQAFESKIRPTKVFFYYGFRRETAEPALVGAATVAEKLSNEFQFTGYPVIARCLISEEFRNMRLYFPIFKHRFDYCLSHFDKNLKAIHVGSQNERILSCIKRNFFGLSFCYVGDELLKVKGAEERVHDFLWFSPETREEFQSFFETNSGQPNFEPVKQLFTQMLNNSFSSHDFYALSESIAKIPSLLVSKDTSTQTVNEIITLLNAIPVLKEKPQESSVTVHFPVRRVA